MKLAAKRVCILVAVAMVCTMVAIPIKGASGEPVLATSDSNVAQETTDTNASAAKPDQTPQDLPEGNDTTTPPPTYRVR